MLARATQPGTAVLLLWSDATVPSGTPSAKLVPSTSSIQFGLTSTASLGTYDFRLVDVTGDGRRDVVVGARDIAKLFVFEGGPGLVGTVAPRAVLASQPSVQTNPRMELDGFLDLTGDGVRDILVSVPGRSSGPHTFAGGVDFWRGGATLSGTLAPEATLVAAVQTNGAQVQARAVGDVTGDGVLDVVGFEPHSTARVLVWAGPASWTGEVPPSAQLESPHSSSADRIRLVDGDGDGVLDVLSGIGTFSFWKGGPGLDGVLSAPHAVLAGPETYVDAFVLRDVTGEGVRDLVAWHSCAAIAGPSCSGALFVWKLGQALSGTVAPTARLFDPAAAGGEETGRLVRIGDVSGDGFVDLVASAPFADVGGAIDAGLVHVWRGGPALAGDVAPTATLRSAAPVILDELGVITGEGGLQLADVTGDGVLDVVAGAEQKDLGFVSNVGAVHVWSGGAALTGALAPTATLQVGGALQGDLLGDIGDPDFPIVGPLRALGIRVAEVTGDGVLDVIAAAHGADVSGSLDAGAAYVWAGGPGLAGATNQTAALKAPGASASDQLGVTSGHGLQIADVSGDGISDVIVGASLADVGGFSDAGALHVWPGGSGLTGNPLPAVLTASDRRANDLLGTVLDRDYGQGILAADVTGDGVLDLFSVCTEADISGVSNAGALYLWAGPIGASATETYRLRAAQLASGGRVGF